jgi:hypothetical protein
MDLVPYIDRAHALLSDGSIPDRGTVTSFGSYAPPGTSWLFLPGVALFSDPRLFEFPGTGLLHVGTSIGIFLLARLYFGVRCALLAVLLYGLSELGLFFAGSLQPRGHPFFYVWMVYWACRWVARRDARYLAAALVTWVGGMYVFMEIAPALLILPAIWFFWRPPVGVRSLALVGVAALVIWYPYLRFEGTRRFADLRSQVLRQNIWPASYKEVWCDRMLTIRRGGNPPSAALASDTLDPGGLKTPFVTSLGRRVLAIARGLVFNFEGRISGIEFVLLGLTLGGLFSLSVPQGRVSVEAFGAIAHPSIRPKWLTLFAIAILLFGVIANEFVIGRYLAPRAMLVPYTASTIRSFQALAVLAGLALLMRASVARALKRLAIRFQAAEADSRPLVLSLALPWLILLLAGEHGRPVRFFWLWPVQAVVISACLTGVRSEVSAARRLWNLAGTLIVCGLVGSTVVPVIHSALKNGWSGPDAEVVQVVDYVADQVRASGRVRTSVGYQSPTSDWTVAFAAIDPLYKVGAEVDLLFKEFHGVTNTNGCPEGVARDDEYRIVSDVWHGARFSETPDRYFIIPPDWRFHLIKKFSQYEVYKRS